MDYVIVDDNSKPVDNIKPGQLFVHASLLDVVYIKCNNGAVVSLKNGEYYEPARVGSGSVLLVEPKAPVIFKRV